MGPTVEELLRAGGQRRKPPPQEQVGAGETFVNRAVGMVPGANRLTDAISALALEAGSNGGTRATLTPEARAELQRIGEDVPENQGLIDRYREVRDRRATRTEAGSEQSPWAGRAGALTGFGLSLFAPLPKASGTGLGAAVKTGAGYGAFQGLTEGGADLTRGEFGEAAGDVLKGAAFGGAMGAGFHGAMRLGQRGVQALRGARQDVLAQETAAAREAADEGQAAAAKAFEKERREVGSAREMNKAFDKKKAKELVQRARGDKAAPGDEPDTKMLQDMRGKAEERRALNYDRVRQRQKDMEDPALTPEGKAENQQYIDKYGHAVNNPGAFRREFIERYLRQRYGSDVADRLMRERIGPGGEVLPRQNPTTVPPQSTPPPGPERATGVHEVALSELDDIPAKAWNRGRSDPIRQGYSSGAPIPPIRVTQGDDGLRELVDGNHRLAIARELGIPRIQVDFESAEAAALRQGRPRGSSVFNDAVAPMDAARTASPVMASRQLPSPIAPPPAIREGATGMPYGRNLRPELPPEPTTQLAQSMAAPEHVSADALPASAASVPNIQRPPTSGQPASLVGAPVPSAVGDIQDVTRLAGPEDVGPLATERAAAREQSAFRAVGRAGYDGVRAGQSTLGAIFGGLGGVTREMLRDPAVKARVLAAARLHVLARINPALYARVGAQLQSAGPHQRTAEHLLLRKDPEYREARQKAAEQVAVMSDQQLVELFAQAGDAP